MSNGNENAGRQPAPAGPARRPSITSAAALAAHLGRVLSATAVGRQRMDGPTLRAALDWAALTRALLAVGARLDAPLGWLTVIDGPLHGIRRRRGLPVIGYVKMHHRRMLAREHWVRVTELTAGERSGLFA